MHRLHVNFWAACAVGLALAPIALAAPNDAAFYSYPRGARQFTVRQVRTGAISRFDVTWPSWVRTGYPEDDTARALLFYGTGPARRPAVVVLHSWRSRNARSEIALCRILAERGFVSMLLILPFHMSRTPRGSDSGDLMITADLERTARAFRQAVVDARTAVDFLSGMDRVDRDEIGIAGVSLGAVVAAIAMGVEPRFKAGVLILGGGDVHTILRKSLLFLSIRHRIGEKLPPERTEELLRLIDPVTFAGNARGRPILMVNGRRDLFMPVASAEALWKALGRPRIIWLPTGHYGPLLVSKGIFDLAATFLADSFGLERKPLPRISAPGIKFSLLMLSDGAFRPWVGVELTSLGTSSWIDLSYSELGLSVQALRSLEPGVVGGFCLYRSASAIRAAAVAGLQITF